MDKERFTERILETENLTDELEDAEAQWLLDWGIAALDPLLEGLEDAEIAGAKVNALMAVMRKLNRLVGGRDGKTSEELAADFSDLDGLARAINPGRSNATPQDCLDAAQALAGLDARSGLEYAARWNLSDAK